MECLHLRLRHSNLKHRRDPNRQHDGAGVSRMRQRVGVAAVPLVKKEEAEDEVVGVVVAAEVGAHRRSPPACAAAIVVPGPGVNVDQVVAKHWHHQIEEPYVEVTRHLSVSAGVVAVDVVEAVGRHSLRVQLPMIAVHQATQLLLYTSVDTTRYRRHIDHGLGSHRGVQPQ